MLMTSASSPDIPKAPGPIIWGPKTREDGINVTLFRDGTAVVRHVGEMGCIYGNVQIETIGGGDWQAGVERLAQHGMELDITGIDEMSVKPFAEELGITQLSYPPSVR